MMKHYGWLVSPYTAKSRSYLQYIGVDFLDVVPTGITLQRVIKPAVGHIIMPTVQLDDGRWLQDSSVIIDHFERDNMLRSIHPQGKSQVLASYLLEVFADEWLPMAALHYRWNLKGNRDFALDEFARSCFPYLPRFIGKRLVSPLAKRLQGYLPQLGVTKATIPAVEETVELVLNCLNKVLAKQCFLLGDRPCLGDFAMFGPLWAHLYRDPASTYLFQDKQHIIEWFGRLCDHPVPEGEFLDNDTISKDLDPLFQCILVDQWGWHTKLIGHIDGYCAKHPEATRVPRALGDDEVSIRGVVEQRKLITFTQWKAQRVVDAHQEANGQADKWLQRVLQGSTLTAESCFPAIRNPFELQNFKAVLKDKQ